jgi:hypothetical protein
MYLQGHSCALGFALALVVKAGLVVDLAEKSKDLLLFTMCDVSSAFLFILSKRIHSRPLFVISGEWLATF